MGSPASKKNVALDAIVGAEGSDAPTTAAPAVLTEEARAERRRQLRNFGLLVGTVFLLMAGWQFWRHRTSTLFYAFGSAGSALTVVGLILPIALWPIFRGWMFVGGILGWINTRILLGVVFFLIFAPVSIVLRLLSKDPLHRRWDKKQTSYWVVRSDEPNDPDHFRNQY